jgi:hypothetical protein
MGFFSKMKRRAKRAAKRARKAARKAGKYGLKQGFSAINKANKLSKRYKSSNKRYKRRNRIYRKSIVNLRKQNTLSTRKYNALRRSHNRLKQVWSNKYNRTRQLQIEAATLAKELGISLEESETLLENAINDLNIANADLSTYINPDEPISNTISSPGNCDTKCLNFRGCFDYDAIYKNNKSKWSKRIYLSTHRYYSNRYKRKILQTAICDGATHIGIFKKKRYTWKRQYDYVKRRYKRIRQYKTVAYAVYGKFSNDVFKDEHINPNNCYKDQGLFMPRYKRPNISIYRINSELCNSSQIKCNNKWDYYRSDSYTITTNNDIPKSAYDCSPKELVETFYSKSPTVCMPPDCLSTDNTPPAIRMNTFDIREQDGNVCNSNNPNACTDDLYSTNSLGVSTIHSNSNPLGTIHKQPYNKKAGKIFVNCPNDFDNIDKKFICNGENEQQVDITCKPLESQVPHQDYISGLDITMDLPGQTECSYYKDDGSKNGVSNMWLTQNTPQYNEFNDAKQCKKWCSEDNRCGGVQTFYDFKYTGASKSNPVGHGYTYCNYYNKDVDLNNDNYNNAVGYDTWVKRKIPYSITPNSPLPDDCKDTDIGFGCCPDRITSKKNNEGSNCSLGNDLYHTDTGVNPKLGPNHTELLGGTNTREINQYELFTSNKINNCVSLFIVIFIIILFYYYR